jgi:leucyl aminopeptidase
VPIALISAGDAGNALKLRPLTAEGLAAWLPGRSDSERAYVANAGFTAEAGSVAFLPGAGGVGEVLVGIGNPVISAAERDLWALSGNYRLAEEPEAGAATLMALGWEIGAYVYERYKPRKRAAPKLVWPANADAARVTREAAAIFLARDLINTPAADLGPVALADAVADLARKQGAAFKVIVGDELLAANYPMIHAVGRAAVEAPRLIDLVWGEGRGPRVTIVGKGVCFDSGGLDLKPPASMKIMKKDMGGSANAIALAQMIMAANLGVRLRLLVPAVENAIDATAYRPLDVLKTRKGVTVEVGNTDAEGRLVLADALVEADSEKPDLLIDMATLTANARIALGPDLPAMYSRHDDLAAAFLAKSAALADPMWRMPLWPHYRKQIDSRVATMTSVSESAFNGSIIAALFLADFVSPQTRWAHIDFSAWNYSKRPGRPEGGEAMTIRALFAAIADMAKK